MALHSLKSISSEIFDLSLKYPEAGTFSISLKESHKSAHSLQTGVFCCGDCKLESEILKGIGGSEIIVFIVLIVTLCLNEAKLFSLFNATQILSIQI